MRLSIAQKQRAINDLDIFSYGCPQGSQHFLWVTQHSRAFGRRAGIYLQKIPAGFVVARANSLKCAVIFGRYRPAHSLVPPLQ
jgi:hypothetical protein